MSCQWSEATWIFDLPISSTTPDGIAPLSRSNTIMIIFVSFLGRSVAGLVKEFLQFFDLDYTLAVFDAECSLVSISWCWNNIFRKDDNPLSVTQYKSLIYCIVNNLTQFQIMKNMNTLNFRGRIMREEVILPAN